MKNPLAGIRVISMAEQWPGPLSSMILADLGADVIMVERPQGGDPTRRFTGHFEALNRNKRSIVLDLKSEAGRQLFEALLATADVLMDGFRPKVLRSLGFGAEQLRSKYPALIYTSISSFGHTGPLSERGGHDLLVQGLAGYVSGGENPSFAPLALGDLSSAMYSTIGIVTALYDRKSSGKGSHIDISMLDTALSWRSTYLVSALNDLISAPYPPDDPGYGVFRVGKSGKLITLSIAGEDHQWRELCDILHLNDLAGLTTIEREQRQHEIRQKLAETLLDHELGDIEDELAARGVGIGQVNDNLDVAENPQIIARGMIADVQDTPGLRVLKQPIRFDGWSGEIKTRAPELGENTHEVLVDLGYSNADIEAYIAGVVPSAK